jgi:hypothetical protein
MQLTKKILNRLIYGKKGVDTKGRLNLYRQFIQKYPDISDDELKEKFLEILPHEYGEIYFKFAWIMTFVTGVFSMIILNKITVDILSINRLFDESLQWINYLTLAIKWVLFYVFNCYLAAYFLSFITLIKYSYKVRNFS